MEARQGRVAATAAPTKDHRRNRNRSLMFSTEGRTLLNTLLPPNECPMCQNALNIQPHAILQPCEHGICALCLSELAVSRKPTEFVSCPWCGKAVLSHRQVGFSTDNNRDALVEKDVIEHVKPLGRNVDDDPCPKKDPYRHWLLSLQNNDIPPDVDQGLLYLAVTKPSMGTMRAYTASFAADRGFLNCVHKDMAVKIFAGLNQVVYHSSSNNEAEQKFDERLGTQLISKAIDSLDVEVAPRLLFALARGENLPQGELSPTQSSPLRSQFMASWIASELLKSCSPMFFNRKRLSSFQTFVGTIVSGFGAQQRAIDILSDLRLSCSYSHLQRLKIRDTIDRRSEPLLLQPDQFLCHSTDNFDTKKHGRDAGCVSHTISTISIKEKHHHQKFGLCQADPSKRISRVSQSFEEAKLSFGEDAYRQMIGIRDEELEVFSFYKLRHIEYVISLALPSVEECRACLLSEDFTAWKRYLIGKNLGMDVHPQKRYDVFGNRLPFQPRRYDESAMPLDYEPNWSEDGSTLLSRNQMIVDIPQAMNLGATATVKGLMEKFLALNKTQLEGATTHAGDEPPVAELMVPMCLDGQPAAQALRILAEDALSDEPKLQRVKPFAGGFHTVKKTIERMNLIFDAIVSTLIENFRSTVRKQKEFLDPHDPNDFEKEIIGVAVALYEEACCQFQSMTGRSMFSAEEVHDMMVRRSKENPSSMHFHNYLGFVTVYFILRDSEKCNSIDLFFSAIRLVLPLFCASHATDYVRICHEILIWKATACEADVRLFQEYCFTSVSADGKYLFKDKAQEKVNGYIRAEVGDVVLPGYEQKLVQVCENMDEMLQQKRDNKQSKGLTANKSSGLFNKQTVAVGIEYAAVRVAASNAKVWAEGESFMIPQRAGGFGPARSNHLISLKGNPIRSEVLQLLSIGISRSKDYFRKFDDRATPMIGRPETGDDGVALTRIESREDECQALFKRRLTLASSTNKQTLLQASQKRKAPLLAEIRFTKDQLLDQFPAQININDLEKDRTSLDQLASALVSCRKIWKQLNNGEVPVRDDVYADCRSDPSTRTRELRDHHFGRLKHSVVQQFRSQNSYR